MVTFSSGSGVDCREHRASKVIGCDGSLLKCLIVVHGASKSLSTFACIESKWSAKLNGVVLIHPLK